MPTSDPTNEWLRMVKTLKTTRVSKFLTIQKTLKTCHPKSTWHSWHPSELSKKASFLGPGDHSGIIPKIHHKWVV